MILPSIGLDSASKRFSIVEPSADIDDVVVLGMFLGEELGDIFDRVAISLFYPWGWKSHCDDPLGDVGEVEVILIFDDTIFGTCHDSSDAIEHETF